MPGLLPVAKITVLCVTINCNFPYFALREYLTFFSSVCAGQMPLVKKYKSTAFH